MNTQETENRRDNTQYLVEVITNEADDYHCLRRRHGPLASEAEKFWIASNVISKRARALTIRHGDRFTFAELTAALPLVLAIIDDNT